MKKIEMFQELMVQLAIINTKLDKLLEQTQVTNTIHIDYDWREPLSDKDPEE